MYLNADFYGRYGKSALDIVLTVSALLLLLPLLPLLAMFVGLKIGVPIFFTQDRPGLHGTAFRLYKFRTMSCARDANGALLPDSARLTPFGRFLRSTSLDELPELWNVLKGDLSLVGPRPLLTQYMNRYTLEQARRHEIKPGITGWAQVNGRNGITWEEKFKLDIWYLEHRSFNLDLKIISLTIWKILGREGISQSGHVTMEEFKGVNNS